MSGVDEHVAHSLSAPLNMDRLGGMLFGELGLIQHTTATGGVLVVHGNSHRLTPIQYELLRILWTQARADMAKPEPVRGFVSSYELLCSLPWEACHPAEDHLKQLIRRIRRRFHWHGLSLESCKGLGYRLKVVESASQPVGSRTC